MAPHNQLITHIKGLIRSLMQDMDQTQRGACKLPLAVETGIKQVCGSRSSMSRPAVTKPAGLIREEGSPFEDQARLGGDGPVGVEQVLRRRPALLVPPAAKQHPQLMVPSCKEHCLMSKAGEL